MAGMFDDLLSYLMGGTQMGNFLGVGSPTASTQTPVIPPATVGAGPMLGGAPPAPAGGGGLLGGLLGGQPPAGGPPQMHQGLLGDSPLGNMLAGAFAGAGSVQPGQTGLAALGAGAQGAMTANQQRQQEQLKNWYMQQTVQQANQKTQAAQQQRDYLANAAPPPGVDPAQWKTYVEADPEGAMAVLGKAMAPDKPTHSAIYNEYLDAVASGYKGSFIDYQNEDANRKRSISHTTNVTNMPKPAATMAERDRDILLHGDPNTAEYAAAYANFMQPQIHQNPDGTWTQITPPAPTWAKPPTYGGPGAAGGTAVPADTSIEGSATDPSLMDAGGNELAQPVPTGGTSTAPPPPAAGGASATPPAGPTVKTGGTATQKPPAPLTQDEQKTRQLYQHSAQQLPDILKNYDELAKTSNMLSAKIGGTLGNATMSGPAQIAYNGLLDFASSYLYVTSGATANPGEVQNLAQTLMPQIGDDTSTLAAKKARLQDMLLRMRGRAGLPAEGGQGGNKKWVYKNGELVPEGAP